MRVVPTLAGYWRLIRQRPRLEGRRLAAMSRRVASASSAAGILGLTAAYRLAQAGVDVTRLRALGRSRRARRLVRLRRPPRRPLLPRDPADRRPRARPRRGARARRPLPVPPDRRRLLRRRPAVLDELAARVPDAFRCCRRTTGCGSRAFVAALPADLRPLRARRDALLEDWLRRLCGTPDRRAPVAAAARLEVRRAASTTCRPRYLWARTRRMSSTRDSSRPRDHGLARGRLRDAHRRARRDDRRARRRDPRRHGGRPDRRVARRRAAGVVVDGTFRPFDLVALHARCRRWRGGCSPRSSPRVAPEDHCRYLGVVCLVAADERRASARTTR